MKAILFVLGIVGFYYGMSQYGLSEHALSRWIKKTHFPNREASELFCAAIHPTTKVNYSYTYNKLREKTAATEAEELCPYWKKQIIYGAKLSNSRVSISNLRIERHQKFPFNTATASFDYKVEAYPSYKTGYIINRHETLIFSRNLLGDYRLKSISGYERLQWPEKS